MRKVVQDVRWQKALECLAIGVLAELAEGLKEQQHLDCFLRQILELRRPDSINIVGQYNTHEHMIE
jgi:hypothetical protein